MDPAVISALAAILGSAVGGAATIYVATRSLPTQAKQAEVALQTLLLHQGAQTQAQRQRWDEERHRTYADFMSTVSRHRRVLLHLCVEGAGEGPPRAEDLIATRDANLETSAKYNAVRLLAGEEVSDAAKELLIIVDWYVQAIERRRTGEAPEPEGLRRIVDKYERDAPRFVAAVQAELGLRTPASAAR